MPKNPPYYIIPLIREYKTGSEEQKKLLAPKIALAIGNPTALRTVLGLSPEEFNNFYPDMRLSDPTTTETISTFIDKFGDPGVTKQDSLDEIMTPPSSYSISDLEDLPELESDGSDSIPDFDRAIAPAIEEKPDTANKEPESPAAAPQTDTIEDLQQRLRELVKTGEYEQAIDTIMEINLINPKKSIYFADQIRFLKKLIDLNK